MLVSIFQGKEDVRNCSTYKGVKLLQHTMKIAERVLERRIRELVNIDSMSFGFVPRRGTTDALYVVQRIQEEYKKKKLCICVVHIEKAFDRVPRKVMKWARRKKDLTEVIVRAVTNLYHRTKTKV